MVLNFFENMEKKDVKIKKRKYHIFKHHAWAGLGFLAVLFAIRVIFPLSDDLLSPIIFILVIYVLVALIFTYKYSSELTSQQPIEKTTLDSKKDKNNKKIIEKQVKIEKKRTKAEVKRKKKAK